MRLVDLAVVVHQQIGAVAVQHAGPAAGDRGRMQAALRARGRPPRRRRSRSAVSSRNGWNRPMAFEPPPMQAIERIRQPAFGLLHLLARLVADDRLEVAHHHRIGMRAGDRADAVERVGDVGDPVAQRLVHRVLERLRARLHRHAPRRRASSCATRSASAARRRPSPCRRRIRGRTCAHSVAVATPCMPAPVSAITRGLPMRLRQHDLAEHVVHLVRAGVVEVLALEVDFGAAAGGLAQCAVRRSAK